MSVPLGQTTELIADDRSARARVLSMQPDQEFAGLEQHEIVLDDIEGKIETTGSPRSYRLEVRTVGVTIRFSAWIKSLPREVVWPRSPTCRLYELVLASKPVHSVAEG